MACGQTDVWHPPEAVRHDAHALQAWRRNMNEIKTLCEFYLAIATLAAHECFAFGCGSLFA